MGKSVVESFVEQIIDDSLSSEEKIYSILSARGFLLERDRRGISLSDNSAMGDDIFLKDILKQAEIGEISQGILKINDKWREREIQKFFTKRIGFEACAPRYWDKWNYFKSRVHGKKICAGNLDPFVARLVKAISAIGIITWCSCDGHGNNRVFIDFSGRYNRIWFAVVFKNFVKPRIEEKNRWLITRNNNLRILNPDRNILELYTEIQDVASTLYSNRVSLRAIKSKVVKSIEPKAILEAEGREVFRVFQRYFRQNFPSHNHITI